MQKLIAKRPVLYMGLMYQAGDRLPAQDNTMVAAWLSAGSAVWTGRDNGAAEAPASEEAYPKERPGRTGKKT